MPSAPAPFLQQWFCPACSHPVSAVTRRALDDAITEHKIAAVVKIRTAGRPHPAEA